MNGSLTWVRVGGVCGIIFAFLQVAPLFGGGTLSGMGVGGATAPGNEVIATYATASARFGAIAIILGTPFAPWFLATLTLLLWTRPAARPYAAVGMLAAALGVGVLTIDACVRAALVYGQLNDSSAQALNTIYHTFGIGERVMVPSATLAFGLAQLRMGVPGLWRWAAYVALLAALLAAIADLIVLGTGIGLAAISLPGLLLFTVWIGLTGVLQIWRCPEVAGMPAATPAGRESSAVSA